MDATWDETNGQRYIEEHQGVGDQDDGSVLRTLQLDVILDRPLCQIIGFNWNDAVFLVRTICSPIVFLYLCDLVNQILVVLHAFDGTGHVSVVPIVESFVEGLHVSDENLGLPLLRSRKRILIVIEEEGELHTASIEDALVAFGGLVLTLSTAKNGISQNGRANGIETRSCLPCERSHASSQSFDVLICRIIIVQYGVAIMEILHRAFDNATFTRDRLVTEIVQGEFQATQCRSVVLDSVLESIEHLKIWMSKYVLIQVIIRNWGDPASVNSEEEAELFGKVFLFNIGAGFCWDPQLLRIRLIKTNKVSSCFDIMIIDDIFIKEYVIKGAISSITTDAGKKLLLHY